MRLSRRHTPGIKVIARKEHGKEKENHGVGYDGDPEVVELGLPRWRAWRDDFCSVGTNHLVWISHKEWDGNPDERKY